MSTFISYNYATGYAAAMRIADELRRLDLDPWWLPNPIPVDQVDDVVNQALENCNRCIVVRSTAAISSWQIAEIVAINGVWQRQPRSIDAFVILEDAAISAAKGASGSLPFLGHAEKLQYDLSIDSPGGIPDLGFLHGIDPGIIPLTYHPGRRPVILRHVGQGLAGGKHFLIGGFADEGTSTAPSTDGSNLPCWLVLEDQHGQWYVQSPRPMLTHQRRWLCPRVNLGEGICSILLIACEPRAHDFIIDRVLCQKWDAMKPSILGRENVHVIDRYDPGRLPTPVCATTSVSVPVADVHSIVTKPAGGDSAVNRIGCQPPASLDDRATHDPLFQIRGRSSELDFDQMMDLLGEGAWRWFEAHRDPDTCMVRDRGANWRDRGNTSAPCSVAANGYYLSLLPEAVRLGRISATQAGAHARRMMEFTLAKLSHHHGLLYHFVDTATGQRAWPNVEYSLLDTAIFLNGCIVAAVAFPGVATLADDLLDRVEWSHYFMEFESRGGARLLSYGWEPGSDSAGAFKSPADVRSSENLMPCILAAGSRTYPVDRACWYNTKIIRGQVAGHDILNPNHALFTSHYGLGWADLRGKPDADGVDLWTNARDAALANRAACLASAATGTTTATYLPDNGGWWGVSAGDSPRGYVASNPIDGDPDGTAWPTVAIACLPWIEDILRTDIARWRASPAWQRVLGLYGLAPFTLHGHGWVGEDLIAIDVGAFAVNLANHRNRTIWDLWSQHPVPRRGLRSMDSP